MIPCFLNTKQMPHTSSSLRHLCFLIRTTIDQIPKGAYYVDELWLKTSNNYGQYLRYYMTDFVTGENKVFYSRE
jgi:hypothetical protein